MLTATALVLVGDLVSLFAPTSVERLAALLSAVSLLCVRLTRRRLAAVREGQADHQEQLRLAQLRLDRVAERDHELRNGLAGLAGAIEALARVSARERDALRAAVVTELARLGALLGGPARVIRSTGGYPVHPVVRDVVLVWGATGMRIELDVDPELWVEGSPDVLAQVLTNVIANCARHASGSPVRVRAALSGQRVRVSVSDSGPGLRGLCEREVFDRRARGPASPGQGLGLYLCRELLARDGGTIRMSPARPDQPGCTVVIELAAVGPARPRSVRAATPRPMSRPIPGALPSAV